MKKIVSLLLLAVFGISCTKQTITNKEQDLSIIDCLAETTPLMQPYLCLSFSKEGCDSIKNERQIRLNKYVKQAKSIKNKDKAIEQFMMGLSEIRSDVNLDHMRALNHNLTRQ